MIQEFLGGGIYRYSREENIMSSLVSPLDLIN